MATPTVSRTPIEYQHGASALEGVLIRSTGTADPAPTVLVGHGGDGRTDEYVEMAERVLPWGYQAFVMDLYGKDVSESTPLEERGVLMTSFLDDRALLADRLSTVMSTVVALPEVDPARVAAMGFCFGGLCVLDMARVGAAVTGVASFHGLLTPPPDRAQQPIGCKVALYHGWDDPWAPQEDVVAVAAELTAAGADWQLHTYGATAHAFMAPRANQPERGILYNARSAERAWSSLRGFLAECLG